MGFVRSILDLLQPLWVGIAAALPRIAAALLLLALGWLLAKTLRRAAIRGLKLARFDVLAERSGLEDFLVQGGVRHTAVSLVASVLYWSMLVAFGLAALNVMGLEAARELLNRIVLYIPNVFAAIFVLVLGTVLARFVAGMVSAFLNNVGIAGAEVMGAAAHFAILFFVVSVALEQLSIGGQILVSAFQIAFGALCLALALAFGLGGREWAAQVLEKLWKK